VKKFPLGSSGIALALFVLSQAYFNAHLKMIGSIIFGVGIIILLMSLISWSENSKKILSIVIRESELGATLPTLGMAIMVFSSILYHFFHLSFVISYSLLWVGIIVYLVLSILFWIFQLQQFSLLKVSPAWYIPTVGSLVIAISGYNFHEQIFSVWVTYFGIACFVLISILLIVKVYYTGSDISKWKSSIAICAAPSSLIVLSSERFAYLYRVSELFIVFSLVLVVLMYCLLPKILENPFNPSMASVTFPAAISSVAIQRSIFHIHTLELKIFMLSITGIELAIATLLIIYVLIGYIKYFYQSIHQIEEKI